MLTLVHMTTPVTFYKALKAFFFPVVLVVNGFSGSGTGNEQRALFAEMCHKSGAFSALAFKLKLSINFS